MSVARNICRFAAWLVLATAASPASGEVIELRCVSDLHGEALRFARLRQALEPDNPKLIRIDAGDTMQGTFESEFTRGRVMTDLLNRFNFDVWVPGNHDFEFGFAPLADAARGFRGHTLGNGWSWFALRPESWTLLRRDKSTVAVIGLTDPAMPRRMLPGDGATFEPPAIALRRIMPEIRKADPDLVVLVWHNGLYSSIGSLGRFLREFPEIDLVIGAHSHEEHPGESVGRAWFVQPGSRAHAAAAIRAEIDDRTRRVRRISSRLLRPEARASQEDFTFVNSAQREADVFGKAVLGRVNPPLRRPDGKAFNTASGRILAEAIRRSAAADVG
ncbi:MAG: metallophosphoesterase, partial [Victivallaceae bacterium]|nr:metallophosphoesterase [Victivallaceae bacterium]